MSIIAVLVLAAACNGGAAFMPLPGPFAGLFTITGGGAAGTFNFTTNGGALGGTGTLVHNAQQVTVAISAAIEGHKITGNVANTSLGSGSFTGTFTTDSVAQGTYTYTDIGNITTDTGTWAAQVE